MVCYLDLDAPAINDERGHEAGDLLVQIARRSNLPLRAEDSSLRPAATSS
jgi:GGDEF domain-containing protein